MPLYITALAASILAILLTMLALKVVKLRQKEKVSVGDGGNDELQRAVRAHANLAEYAPIGLILIACAEFNGVPRLLLAILAIAFVAGRVMHPAGMQNNGSFAARVNGMRLTLVSLLALAAVNILWLLWRVIT